MIDKRPQLVSSPLALAADLERRVSSKVSKLHWKVINNARMRGQNRVERRGLLKSHTPLPPMCSQDDNHDNDYSGSRELFITIENFHGYISFCFIKRLDVSYLINQS